MPGKARESEPMASVVTPFARTVAPRAPIPLVDIGIQTRAVEHEVRLAFERVIASGGFVMGPAVNEFEEAFAAYCGTRHCVAVGNGTDALELGLRALGVGPGDEVVLPANTFVATAEAVMRAGARPVLVDCDPCTYLMDISQVADVIGARTRAVIPVHLYGQVVPMEEIAEIVYARDIAVLEDAAQAQGAQRWGTRAGAFGDAAATSFYPGKNLGAWGDAGAVMTASDQVANDLRALRNHGGEKRYEHRFIGLNSRMDAMQAAVLHAKLAHLDDWNEQRRQAAARYRALLGDVEQIVLPGVLEEGSPVWHLYVVQVPGRDQVLSALQTAGIGAGIHYPAPIHRLPGWQHLDLGPGSFPVSETVAERIISLPIYPGITHAQQERVAEVLRRAVEAL